MVEERKSQRLSLDISLKEEKRKTIKELILWFETKQTPPREREAGLAKVSFTITGISHHSGRSPLTILKKFIELAQRAALQRL